MSKIRKVAVLGANGFIGSRFVEWLILCQKASVRPIVRSFKGLARLARFNLDNLDFRIADANNVASLVPHLDGCDVLFHCVVGNRKTILDSAQASYTAAAKAGVKRLVYLSSMVVHGNDPLPGTHDDSPLVEKQPFEYNVSKVMAEKLLRRLRIDGAVEVVTLRPANVFGPRSQLWTYNIASDLLNNQAYLVYDGLGIFNSVYVDNLVSAMWQAANVPEAANQDFIITDGEKVTWLDMYSAVATGIGRDLSHVCFLSKADLLKLERQMSQKAMIDRIVGARIVHAAGKLLPGQMRRMIKRKLVNSVPHDVSVGSVPGQAINFDIEISSLQQCQYVLPINKARDILGYKPELSFLVACEKTSIWLRFVLGIDNAVS